MKNPRLHMSQSTVRALMTGGGADIMSIKRNGEWRTSRVASAADPKQARFADDAIKDEVKMNTQIGMPSLRDTDLTFGRRKGG